uniref:Uncharacterized protein n=1 Tax=Stomoxys calcitrans TaxID=35570 RepID=A0A1I8P5J8_STOCA
MSESPPLEHHANSKSNLIECQHIGVTAKLQSPLKNLMAMDSSSSTEADNNQPLYGARDQHQNSTKYNKFSNNRASVVSSDSTVTDTSKVLYEMKSLPTKATSNGMLGLSVTPAKIEFQLYTRNSRHTRRGSKSTTASNKKKTKRHLFADKVKKSKPMGEQKPSLFQRFRDSLAELAHGAPNRQTQPTSIDSIFSDLPQPDLYAEPCQCVALGEVRLGIYPFDHGNADYLKTHDCPPHILSWALAERTTHCATKFWAEFFGSLYIGVAFVVTFLLQTYRFFLYSLINTLLVGLLHMTSDYLVKPLLAVLFNGFLQPPLICCFNILTLLRDILQPIADSLNNFMKPLATLARSVRLVHVSQNKKNITKNV